MLLKENAPNEIGAFWKKRRREIFGSAEGIHQFVNGAVQVFVTSAQRVDFVDGVKNGGVVLAAELAANFRKRSGSELLHKIHGHLPREGNRFGI